MFLSNTHWPQLTAPFYSIFFETSICQFNSSECSPIMTDEVREHLTRDQRPFLHPESLQVLQIHSFFSSVHSLIFYRVQVREHLTRDQRPFLHPESLQILQIHSFFSSVHLTHLLQGSGQRTPDKRSETIPSSRITPDPSDSQLLLFSSLTHLLQGSGQRTPDKRSETIPSSRITPDPSDSQLLLFSSLTHLLQVQVREHLTRDQRPFLHPESLQILQIHSFFSSVHSLIFYRVQVREHLTRDQRPFLHPESLQILQIHSFFSSVHLTHLLQGSGQRTPDKRSETIPSSRITPDPSDSQLLLFSSLTHLLQGSGQRTPDKRSETIPSSRITPDPSDSQLLLFSSPHSSSTGFRSENTWHEIRDHSFIQNHSRSFRFTASSLQFTSLIFYRVQVREHLTRDQRPFLHPESLQILQIHSFFSSVHLTHLLQGSGQRTPDKRSETIPSSRITPGPSDSQLLLFSSPHSSSTGFRSEDWDGYSRSLLLCSVTHFCVVFEVCVWVIVRLEDPNMAHYKISNRVSNLLILYLLVFDIIHDAMCLN